MKAPAATTTTAAGKPVTAPKRKTYKLKIQVMEVKGESPYWKKGDRFEFDDTIKVEEKKTGKGPKYGKTLNKSSISSGVIDTYSITQLHPILVAMGRGGVGADELGIGEEQDIGYVACDTLGVTGKSSSARVFFKLVRVPTKISQSDLFFGDLEKHGKGGGRYAGE